MPRACSLHHQIPSDPTYKILILSTKEEKKKYQRNHASKNPLVYIKDEKQVKSILFHLTIVFRNLIIFELMIQKEKRINLKDILTLYIKNKKHEVCSVHLILVKLFP